jgi:hypothetical protein
MQRIFLVQMNDRVARALQHPGLERPPTRHSWKKTLTGLVGVANRTLARFS